MWRKSAATWRRPVANYGISRQCYYGWLRRFEADGLDGLNDRSQRPHHSPRATQADIVEKIIWLRQHYHFGPAKIAMYLGCYHDVTISTSGVADLEAARNEPAARLAALPTPDAAVETL